MPVVALVEDDSELAEVVAEFLESRGFDVRPIDDREAVASIVALKPDAAVLDVQLPSQTGFAICRGLREQGFRGAVVFLTARDGRADEMLAFELGGDDFVRKPFDPDILALRLQAALRRREAPQGDAITRAGLSIDTTNRTVSWAGQTLELTTAQYRLLVLLTENFGEVVDRETYYTEVRGIPYNGVDRTYDNRVSDLRDVLARYGVDTLAIRTVRGEGYVLVATG